METAPTNNKPEIKFRAGAISASIWQNKGQNKQTGEEVSFNTISLQRVYKDKTGNWKNTNTFRVSDLPKAALVIRKAYEHLVLKGQDDSSIVVEEIA